MSDQPKTVALVDEIDALMEHVHVIAQAIATIKAAPVSEAAKKVVIGIALEEGVRTMTSLSLSRGAWNLARHSSNPNPNLVAELLRAMATPS